MKKAFALVILILTPTMAFSQGTVVFNNNQTSLVTLNGNAAPVGDVYVELIAAPVGTPLPSPDLTTYVTMAGFLTANPGWIAPGPYPFSFFPPAYNPGGLAADGIFSLGVLAINVQGGANAEYFVIGWTGPHGGAIGSATTYDAAMALGNCFFGESAIFTTSTGTAPVPPVFPVPLANSFGGLAIVVPEPSAVTIAGLGALLLTVFRRRD